MPTNADTNIPIPDSVRDWGVYEYSGCARSTCNVCYPVAAAGSPQATLRADAIARDLSVIQERTRVQRAAEEARRAEERATLERERRGEERHEAGDIPADRFEPSDMSGGEDFGGDDDEEYEYDSESYRGRCVPHKDGVRRLVGIEWEYNEAYSNRKVRQWAEKWGGSIHSDGSCGWEAVTPPVSGRYLAGCVYDMGRSLAGSEIDKRCGLHVHVDATDYTWNDMVRLCVLYAKVEPLLYAVGGDFRVRSSYCGPMGTALSEAFKRHGRTKDAVCEAVFGRTSAGGWLRNVHKKDGARYRGLNIVPWISQKAAERPDQTVEFRLHRNTGSAVRVFNWASLCETLVSYAASHTMREVDALPSSPLRTLSVVAPKSMPYIVRRLAAWRDSVSPKNRRVEVKGKVWSCAV